MNSLDPRISRFIVTEKEVPVHLQHNPEQLFTFEVFLQKKENLPFDHVGIVHAPAEEMAFIFAKEQFSRRFTCTGLMLAKTQHVMVSPYTDLEEDVYDLIDASAKDLETEGDTRVNEKYEIFHLTKRGKQHRHVGNVEAFNYDDALIKSKEMYKEEKPVLNIWIIKAEHLRITDVEDKDIWDMLPEKTHRDVTSYRAKDKIEHYKAQKSQKDKI